MVLHLFNPDGSLNDEAVQDAIKTLKDGTLDDKEKAAKALDRMLQMHEQQRAVNSVVVVKRGVILPCVQMLKDGTPGGLLVEWPGCLTAKWWCQTCNANWIIHWCRGW